MRIVEVERKTGWTEVRHLCRKCEVVVPVGALVCTYGCEYNGIHQVISGKDPSLTTKRQWVRTTVEVMKEEVVAEVRL